MYGNIDYIGLFSSSYLLSSRYSRAALLIDRSSVPASRSGPFSPLPTRVHVFIFIKGIIQRFLLSSTGVALYPPTLLGVFSS